MIYTSYFQEMKKRPDRKRIKEEWIMRIKYFEDTDTALLEFTENDVWETRGISESIVVDVDRDGNLVSLTIEHAGEKANIRNFSFESVVTKSA